MNLQAEGFSQFSVYTVFEQKIPFSRIIEVDFNIAVLTKMVNRSTLFARIIKRNDHAAHGTGPH